MDKNKALRLLTMKTGTAWIANGFRPIRSARLISKGQHKGKYEVVYWKYRIKKAIVRACDVRAWPEGGKGND